MVLVISSFLIRLQNEWDSGGVGICDVRLHRGKGRPAMEYPCPTPSHTRCLSALPKDLKGFFWTGSQSPSVPELALIPDDCPRYTSVPATTRRLKGDQTRFSKVVLSLFFFRRPWAWKSAVSGLIMDVLFDLSCVFFSENLFLEKPKNDFRRKWLCS